MKLMARYRWDVQLLLILIAYSLLIKYLSNIIKKWIAFENTLQIFADQSITHFLKMLIDNDYKAVYIF